jgi:hypothetical protein
MTCSRGKFSRSRTDRPDETTPQEFRDERWREWTSCVRRGTQRGDVVRIPIAAPRVEAKRSGASRIPWTGADVNSRSAFTSGCAEKHATTNYRSAPSFMSCPREQHVDTEDSPHPIDRAAP